MKDEEKVNKEFNMTIDEVFEEGMMTQALAPFEPGKCVTINWPKIKHSEQFDLAVKQKMKKISVE